MGGYSDISFEREQLQEAKEKCEGCPFKYNKDVCHKCSTYSILIESRDRMI